MWKLILTISLLVVLNTGIGMARTCSNCPDSEQARCFVSPCRDHKCPWGTRCCENYCGGCYYKCIY